MLGQPQRRPAAAPLCQTTPRLQCSKTTTENSTHLLPLHTVPPHCLPIQRHLKVHVASCGAAHSLHCVAIAAGQAAQRLHRVGQGVGARLQRSSNESCWRTSHHALPTGDSAYCFQSNVSAISPQLWANYSGDLMPVRQLTTFSAAPPNSAQGCTRKLKLLPVHVHTPP